MSKLDEKFGIEEKREELNDIKSRLKNAEQYEDPNTVLTLNIERAERLLDQIEEENKSAFSARSLEVAANLINTITNAANSMISNQINVEEKDQKWESLDLKKMEFEFKKSKQSKELPEGSTYNQNNIILSDRESVLEFIKNGGGDDSEKSIEDSSNDE